MIQITEEMIITFLENKKQDYYVEGDTVFAKETEKSGQAFRFRLGILVDIYTWKDVKPPQPSSNIGVLEDFKQTIG
jgi:hypothetical protein